MTDQRRAYLGALFGLLVVAVVIALLGTPVYAFFPIAVAAGFLVLLLVRGPDQDGDGTG